MRDAAWGAGLSGGSLPASESDTECTFFDYVIEREGGVWHDLIC